MDETINVYDIIFISQQKLQYIIKKSNEQIKKTINKINKLCEQLNKLNIITKIVPLILNDNGYYYSIIPDYMYAVNGEWISNKFMFFVIHMNEQNTKIVINENIKVISYSFKKEMKKKIISLMDIYLSKQYIWSGRNTDPIIIKYDKLKNNEISIIDIDKLNDDDVHPLLIINIEFYIKENNLLVDDKNIIDNITNNLINILAYENNKLYYEIENDIDEIYYYFYNYNIQQYEKKQNELKMYLKNINKIENFDITIE
jgi:hypothetical protein